MNFTSEQDFQYVTGDLSSIALSNDIMPLRDSDHTYNIYGIDIAFLMEATEERRLARELSTVQSFTNFQNALLSDQLSTLADTISAVYDNGEVTITGPSSVMWLWYEGQPNEISGDIMNQYPVWLHLWQNENNLSVIDSSLSAPMTINAELEAEPIQNMFSNIAQLKTLMRQSFNVYTLRHNNLTFVPNHVKSGGSNAEAQCAYWQRYYMENPSPAFGVAAYGDYNNSNTNYELAYWKYSMDEQAMNDWLPATAQCKDENGNFVGREVYGLFFAMESSWLSGSGGVNRWFIRKISDSDGKVTVASFMAAVNSIRTSGTSQWNYEPPYSAFTAYNSGYFSYIYIGRVYIFDTLSDRTRWDI